MSAAGRIWNALKIKRYGDGGGRAHWCVFFVKCPTCGSEPGELCTGPTGPHLVRHVRRAMAYRELLRKEQAAARRV